MLWSPSFAYAIGLLATDGSLSKDGRHIDFTSADLEQIQTLSSILQLKNKIGTKKGRLNKSTFRIQFGNIELYRFLLSIGLTPNKSKTISKLKIPDQYFADFLRGCFDGDGHTYSYWDKRYKSSFMIYTGFVSSSNNFLIWLNKKTTELYCLNGKIKSGGNNTFQLMFAKKSSLELFNVMYYKNDLPCLKRKYSKIQAALDIISDFKQAEVAKLVYAQS